MRDIKQLRKVTTPTGVNLEGLKDIKKGDVFHLDGDTLTTYEALEDAQQQEGGWFGCNAKQVSITGIEVMS